MADIVHQMADIYALLDEVAGLGARIEATPELPFANLAPRYIALANYALETQLVETNTTEVPHELAMLRKIAEIDMNVPFMQAVNACDALLVELIMEKSSVEGRDAASALRQACLDDSWAIVRLLIDVADVAVDDNFVLQCACEDGQTDIVRLLLDLPVERGVNPAVDDNFPLKFACEEGHTDIVRMLLDLPVERGVNPAAGDNFPLQFACEEGHTDIVRMLLDLPVERGVNPAADDSCALYNACNEGHTDIVRMLLDLPVERGVNPAADNNCALRAACDNGHIYIVRMLLDLPLERGVSLKYFKNLQKLVQKQPVISAMLMKHLISLV